ncbi:hypothetical protein K3495_g6048 [Podosphaera aphanis]|nr:hypothetical protein K3495_g6048 [Podosphaera aphanis]
MTSHIQPLDAGTIASFNAHYRALFNQRALLKFDTGNSFDSIFTIIQLEAMHLADIAWSKVTQVTKANCFRKTGILPQQGSSDVIEGAEGPAQILEESIESLAAGGIFSQAQRPSVSDLLNPCHENDTEFYTSSWTDEEVVQAVQVSFGVNDSSLTLEEDPEPPRIPSLTEILVYLNHVRNFTMYRDKPWARPLSNYCLAAEKDLAREHVNKSKQTNVQDYFRSNR